MITSKTVENAERTKGMPLNEYETEVNGIKTTLQLTEAHAKRLGLVEGDEPEAETKAPAKAPANKSRPAANKSAE